MNQPTSQDMQSINRQLKRIAEALERMSPPAGTTRETGEALPKKSKKPIRSSQIW